MALLAHGAFKHLPTTVGHEVAGTVEAAGVDADKTLMGKRVRVHPTLSCRACAHCRTDREQMCAESAMIGHAAFGSGPLELYGRYHDGGLAEYVRVPHWLVDVLPDNVSFDVAAKVHDCGTVVRALTQAAVPLGGTLVVTAATGAMGAMGAATIRLAPFFGVGRLILVGRSPERLDAVRELATLPTETVALTDLGDWTTAQGLTRRLRELGPTDAVLDYVPEGPAGIQALGALATGGALVHVGGNPADVDIEGWGGTIIDHERPPDCLDDIAFGRADAIVHEAVMLPGWQRIGEDMAFLQVEQEVLDGLERDFGWPAADIEAGYFPGAPAIHTLDFLIVVRADLADDVAHALAWILGETKEVLEHQYAHLAPERSPVTYPLDPPTMGRTPIPLHPGAAEYYSGL